MRRMVLMEAWEDLILVSVCGGRGSRIDARVLSQCKILLENPDLSSYVRYSHPLVYPEYPDTGSDRPKDSSGGLHGRDCQNDGAFRQMSRHPTQPPHP